MRHSSECIAGCFLHESTFDLPRTHDLLVLCCCYRWLVILNGQVFEKFTKAKVVDEDLRIMGGTIIKLFHCEHQDYLGLVNDESTAYDLSTVGVIAETDVESENYDMRSLAHIPPLWFPPAVSALKQTGADGCRINRSLWRIDFYLDKGLQGAPLTIHSKICLRHYATGNHLLLLTLVLSYSCRSSS